MGLQKMLFTIYPPIPWESQESPLCPSTQGLSHGIKGAFKLSVFGIIEDLWARLVLRRHLPPFT